MNMPVPSRFSVPGQQTGEIMDAQALGSTPIQGDSPAGFDAKSEPEYTDVSAEIGKLGSATQGGAVDWAAVATQGQTILEQKSKDLQIAAYVGIAWQETRGIEGLRDAVHLFLGLLGTFWETAFPASSRIRLRRPVRLRTSRARSSRQRRRTC